MGRALRALVVTLAASAMVAGCTVKKTAQPPLAGPSELGTSLTMSATPDVLTQDGASQSVITVFARNGDGNAVANLPIRLEMTVDGVAADYGQLSARSLVTGGDGRATAGYTAPPAPVESVDRQTTIAILATPTGTDYANAVSRSVQIRLVPAGVILPPNGTPTAAFVFSPTAPAEHTSVLFDASSSTDDGTIVGYSWAFGDGSTGAGRVTSHAFTLAGEYTVTLTVTDDRGLKASASQKVVVSASARPTASFVFSPTAPVVGQEVFFNAAASQAGAGRTIVGYDWNFGSGTPQSGMTVSKSYDVPGTYNVTLTVTDDAGKTHTASQSVTVGTTGPGAPVAKISYSPTTVKVGTRIYFNASESSSPSGIGSYDWEFGDGDRASRDRTEHIYAAAGTYVVRLTITDNQGRTATTTVTITVSL